MMQVAVVLMIASSSWLYAQDQELRQELERTKKRLEEIEKKIDQEKPQKSDYPKISPFLTVFAHYEVQLEEARDDFNAVELTRAYFGSFFDFDPHWRARLTLDGVRDSNDPLADREFEVFVKHSWLEYKGLAEEGYFKNASVTFGLVDLPWVPWEEALWGYRFQGEVFVNREGYLTSTDLGIHFKNKLPEELGDYGVMVHNGEGFRRAEGSKHKSADFRVTLTPFGKAVWLTGFAEYGQYAKDEPRIRYIAHLAWRTEEVVLAGEILRARDPAGRMAARQPSLAALSALDDQWAEGWSLYGVLQGKTLGLPEQIAFIARYDWLNPSEEISRDSHYRYITGVSFRPIKNVTLLLDWDRAIFDVRDTRADTNGLFLHVLVTY